ncbi:hypothetical protein BS78_08G118000 [Paspalum vaginatum]|nr:hypothetical protein BS78_08G118000 [Paspalum vaginatum]
MPWGFAVWGCLPVHWRGGSGRSHRGLRVAVVPLLRACCRRGLMCARPERRLAQVGCVATAPRQLVLLRPVQRRSVLRRVGCRGAGRAAHKAMVQRGHGQRGQGVVA